MNRNVTIATAMEKIATIPNLPRSKVLLGNIRVGNFGGVAGFVRPIIMPMAVGTLEAKHKTVNEDYVEDLKGMSSGMENIVWFFCQVLFVGGPGALLVQATLSGLGYEVNLIDLAAVEIPVASFAVLFTVGYYFIKDRRLEKKYYGNDVKNEGGHN